MRRFIICAKVVMLCALSLFVRRANACGWSGTDNYYLFYAFEGDRTTRPATQERLSAWWSKYAGAPVKAEDLNALADVEPAQLRSSRNPLVRAALRRGDKGMVAYLQLLCEYLHVEPQGEEAQWDYPDDQERAARQRAFASVASRAAKHTVGPLSAQYTLLQARALFKAERWKEVETLWTARAKRQAASVFKDMTAGFYAGALRRLGRLEDAAEIYADLGDIHSATWCVRDGRNLGTIRRLYAKDPNSAVLRLLVQDFVNNAQETLDAGDNPEEGEREVYFSRVYADEVAQFAAFAQEAAANPMTQDPSLWLTAAAWTKFLRGDKETGRKLIDRAMTAAGSELTHRTARFIRLAIYAETATDVQTFERFALPEVEWVMKVGAAKDGAVETGAWNCAQRILHQHLVRLYKRFGDDVNAALCIAAAEGLGDRWDDLSETSADVNPLHVSYSTEYASELRTLSGDKMAAYYHQLFNEAGRPMRNLLYERLPEAYRQRDFYADLAGTAYIAEGNCRRAAEWHARVSLPFLSAQDISYYLARRDYNRERWMGPRQTLREVKEGYGGEVPTNLNANQKLQFCKDVTATEEALEKGGTEAVQAARHYRLATLLFQADAANDCWYLSSYTYTTYKEPSKLQQLAYQHLCEAVNLADDGRAPEVYTKALFAKAYINLYAPVNGTEWDDYHFFSYNFDWQAERYSLEFFPDPTRQQSRDFMALVAHVRSLSTASRPDYLSRCDVLQTWLKREKVE